MFVLFEITDIGAAETLLVSLPDSLGVLAFGIILILAAVLTRSVLARGDEHRNNSEITKKA